MLFMACASLENLNNSIATYETGALTFLPSFSATLAVTASTVTHVYQFCNLLATQYPVLHRWRSDQVGTPSLHAAVLEANHTPFTNAATAGYHEVAACDRGMHVVGAQCHALARVPGAPCDWDALPPAYSRGGGGADCPG